MTATAKQTPTVDVKYNAKSGSYPVFVDDVQVANTPIAHLNFLGAGIDQGDESSVAAFKERLRYAFEIAYAGVDTSSLLETHTGPVTFTTRDFRTGGVLETVESKDPFARLSLSHAFASRNADAISQAVTATPRGGSGPTKHERRSIEMDL